MDLSSINTEILDVRSGLNVSWDDFALYCKAKMMEAAIGGGISSYSIGGRSVNKSLDQWQSWHRYAKAQANSEKGSIQMQDITFVNRGSC